MASLPHDGLVDAVVSFLKPRTVLDVGCGTATTYSRFKHHGVEWMGLEGSELCIKNAPTGARIVHANLDKPYRAAVSVDLVWCFEVIEHIHPDFESAILQTLTENGSAILLSAAHPGQGGLGHFNERPIHYWDQKMLERGFMRDHAATSALRPYSCIYPENMAIYCRAKLIM